MFCPYAVNRKMVTQTKMEYDEDGHQTMFVEVQNNKAEFVECTKEECDAWQKCGTRQKGKCNYNGTDD